MHRPILPEQGATLFFHVDHWDDGSGSAETEEFVKQQVSSVVAGRQLAARSPPSIDLLCTHSVEVSPISSCLAVHPAHSLAQTDEDWLEDAASRAFLHSARRHSVRVALAGAHPHVPAALHPALFPLYHPDALDLVLVWASAARRARGLVLLRAGTLGAGHAALAEVLTGAGAQARSMYAETQTERTEMLAALAADVWNLEMNPLVVGVPDASVEHDFAAHGYVLGCVTHARLMWAAGRATHP
jgi:hypothetical protein